MGQDDEPGSGGRGPGPAAEDTLVKSPTHQTAGAETLTVTYVELLRFFVPLAMYPFLVQINKVISNAAIARLPQPETVFAAYSVARSLASPIIAPVWMIRQTAVALVDSRQSYRVVRDTLAAMCAVLGMVILILGFTPSGPWLLREIMGVEDGPMMYHAVWTLRLVALMTLSSMVRNLAQAITIARELTDVIPVGTLFRVLCSGVFLYVVVVHQALSGAAAATLVWAGGIGLEGLFIVVYLRYVFGNLGTAAEGMPSKGRGPLDVGGVMRFFVPLWATSLLGQLVMPLINAGLARTIEPQTAIAAYTVGWELMSFFDAPVLMLHQVVIVFASRSRDAARTVFRFTVAVGLAFSALIWVVSFSPLVTYILAVIIAVPATMLGPATTVLRILSLMPLIRAVREFHWGQLMDERDTTMIGVARAAHLAGTTLGLVLGFASGFFTGSRGLHPASLGAVALLGGELTETAGVAAYARNRGPEADQEPPDQP